MVLVRVHRISSMRDPETGRRGKIIELVEEKRAMKDVRTYGLTEESVMLHRMIVDALSQLQSLGMLPLFGESIKPKMTLYLTEDEYELLGVRLEVNDVYELEFKNGNITFKKAYE